MYQKRFSFFPKYSLTSLQCNQVCRWVTNSTQAFQVLPELFSAETLDKVMYWQGLDEQQLVGGSG